MRNLRLFMLQGALLIGIFITGLCFSCQALSDELAPTDDSSETLGLRVYQRLQHALALYQNIVEHPQNFPWPQIPETPLLHKGDSNNAIYSVRRLLKTTQDLADDAADSKRFDKTLEDAVIRFQWRHGLHADGVIGERTREAMNVSAQDRLRQIQINMQRWLRLNKTLVNKFVLVNVPEFQLHYFDHDQERLTMKVIVGKPSRPTPEIFSKITRLVFNPNWSVPKIIAQKDIIPKILTNPNYLSDNQIRVFTNESGARELNPEDINWNRAEERGFQYHFKQDPGENNALGLVKFEFPNTKDIYLHDTPAKNLFDQDIRAFSSGCIRLEKAFSLVDYLTEGDPSLNHDLIREKLDDKNTAYYRLEHSIPIVITYITSWVDNGNIVHFMNDIYGEDGLSNSLPEKEESDLNEKPEKYDARYVY